MDCNILITDSNANIKMSGQFTFADAQKFREILDLVGNKRTKAINLDFYNVTFIDSSGMGMLLLLRDEANEKDIPLSIISPQGQVEKIFRISKFYDIFSINAA